MIREEKIIKILEKLDELRNKGLIDENYYQEKREILISEYLTMREEPHDSLNLMCAGASK